MKNTRDRNLLLTVYFSFYYVIFLFYFLDHRLLSQYHPIFFNYNRDLTELLLIASGVPRYLIDHPFGLWLADALVLVLPAAVLGHVMAKGRFSVALGALFCLAFTGWLLLANLFWQVDHEPFMLYVFLSLAFCTNDPGRFRKVLAFCRYYYLYIFFTAAMWKIIRGAVFNPDEMSRILLLHHAEVLTGSPGFWLNPLLSYLVDHPGISQLIYIGAVLLELLFVVGFFTRRFDRLLIGAAVLFVVSDLFLMRIPYLIILMGSVTLWIGSKSSRRRRNGIVIYETSHHENLPALLDLSEKHFEKVAVFLTTLSFNNLSGAGLPKERWPKTEFFVQPVGLSNRPFIRQLFGFIRKSRYGHLHIRTLDNNLLIFAIRLVCLPDVQASLTVHAVNEYFSLSFGSFKAITESVAKVILRLRIRHYTFFLPAITENFQRRFPKSIAVCLPSRFYTSSATHHRSGDVFRIVIPGSVDPHRRNYEEVAARLADYLAESRQPCVIELTILGDSSSVYGKQIIPLFQRLESSERFRLRTYAGYVPAVEYEGRIAAADLLWSPLRPQKTSDKKGPEVYGQSIASGLTADLQLGCHPVLAPEWLHLSSPFSEALLPYSEDNGSVCAILDRLLNDPGYQQGLQQKIDKAFSAQLNRENFDAAFRELMDLPPADKKREERRNDPGSSVIHNSQQPVIE